MVIVVIQRSDNIVVNLIDFPGGLAEALIEVDQTLYICIVQTGAIETLGDFLPKPAKQEELDAYFDAHMDFGQFVRMGTLTAVTSAQVGTFLAAVNNNYRIKRALIVNTVNASVPAIDVSTGWPANP